MAKLVITFLKIFFRNPRAWFFVVFLPSGLFAIAAFLSLEDVIKADVGTSYNNFLLIGIMAMALMQTGLYTVGYIFIDYRRLLIFRQLSITPLSASRFITAQILARFVIACLQVLILLAIGIVFFGTNIQNSWLLPLLIFLGSTLFMNLGIIIASIARDYEQAAPYTTLLGIPLVFLGDVFFPVQNLPAALQTLANYLPLKPLSAVLRHVLLGFFDVSLLQDIVVFMLWLVFLTMFARHLFAKKVYK